jgi:hypothetical protein
VHPQPDLIRSHVDMSSNFLVYNSHAKSHELQGCTTQHTVSVR